MSFRSKASSAVETLLIAVGLTLLVVSLTLLRNPYVNQGVQAMGGAMSTQINIPPSQPGQGSVIWAPSK